MILTKEKIQVRIKNKTKINLPCLKKVHEMLVIQKVVKILGNISKWKHVLHAISKT